MNYQTKYAEKNNRIPFIADDTVGRHGIKLIGAILGSDLRMEVTITVSAAGIWMTHSKPAEQDCLAGDEGLDRLCEAMFISCGACPEKILVHSITLKEIESGSRTQIPEGQR